MLASTCGSAFRKEIKTQEFRVGMTPSGVATLVQRGHTVLVEENAGVGSSIPDEAYVKAGAKMVATKEEIWGGVDMVVKVKEPIAPEFGLMRKDLLLFTYLHLAAAHELGKELLSRGVNGVAYETIEPTPGDLPLLTPMSAGAGRMSVQAGATYLERERGGKGVLLGGVPGVKRGRVTVIGGGGVGQKSAEEPKAFKQEELDQILAPIALYPDDLLSQVLMASTYPLEVVQAERWQKQNKSLKGDALAQALEKQDWDPSVKSLISFPDVHTMMSEKLDWTQKLGDAFLEQEKGVMDTVQKLRQKAEEAGNLKTTSEQKVIVEKETKTIVIEPANPQVVYAPTYNPTVVYGAWWYPSYPPYYCYPPGYVAGVAAFSFAAGVAVGAAWGYAWGGFNWHGDLERPTRES